jgi:hypothetical protein
MTTHLGLMAMFSLFVSIVFATLMRETPAAQLKLGGQMFLAFVGAGILVGWLLYPLPL